MSLAQPDQFSDYLVFVDESGDHGMVCVDPGYPMFVLAFCLFGKVDYVDKIGPALQRLKFGFWGHDEQVLHEHEIRKPNKDYSFLFNPARRAEFLASLSQFVDEAPFQLIAAVIRKLEFARASRHYGQHRRTGRMTLWRRSSAGVRQGKRKAGA
jgi:hypothetical protein